MDEIGDKIKRKIEEDSMNVKSRANKDLTIFNLTNKEYDDFITFVKEKTTNKKGYEAINMLLSMFEKNRYSESIIKYNEELQGKVKSLEARILELESSEKDDKKKYIGGE